MFGLEINELLGLFLVRIFVLLFLGILFTQSSLDKIFNWKSNLDWLLPHFSKSPLKNNVPLLLFAITILEFLSGIGSFIAIITLVLFSSILLAKLAVAFSALSLLSLFTGQRMAKDYAGATSLVNYFIVCLVGYYFML